MRAVNVRKRSGPLSNRACYPDAMPRTNPHVMLARVSCDRCRAQSDPLRDPSDVEGSFRALREAGWMDMARAGRGQHRWPWLCPACRPGAPSTGGLTTTDFMPAPEDERKKREKA